MPTSLQTEFQQNAQAAAANRAAFALDGVTVVSLVGSAGSGKTALIETIAQQLKGRIRIAAIVGNPASSRDAERLMRLGVRTVAVQTDNLTATGVRSALADLDLPRTDLVMIESTGNDLSPVELDLGQDLRLAVFSVSGGDDKAAQYSRLIADSDMVLLTKVDLLPYIRFDAHVFRTDVARAKPTIELLKLSCKTRFGVDQLLRWIAARWSPDKHFRPDAAAHEPPDWFYS